MADALRMEAEHLGVKLALGNQVLALEALPEGKGARFAARTEGWTYEGDACVLAAGSAAAPATGSDGSGYALAQSLGHRIIKPLPALTALRCREAFYGRLAGLRMEAVVRILADGKELASDRGEVQFTKNGISGIPVFQVSVSRCAPWMRKESGRKAGSSAQSNRKRRTGKIFSKQAPAGRLEGKPPVPDRTFPEKMSLCLLNGQDFQRTGRQRSGMRRSLGSCFRWSVTFRQRL